MVLAIPICNLQRCLARSIFCHLELVLFYSVKFYLASCVIIHLKVDVAGSNPSKSSLVQFVRRTVIDKIISNRFIKFSFRITIPTLMYFTSVSKIYRRVTINFCNSNIPITVACLTNVYSLFYPFLILPFNFFAFSFAIDSIVLAMDNLASGNNIFDNDSNILYVSFVSETFLYLLMSVMRVSFHFNNSYIGDIIGLSMKILLSMLICSSMAG